MPDDSYVILFEISVIFVLILINGWLSMSEMAVVSSRKARLQALQEEGSRGAAIALKLLQHPSDFLASIQIGITLVGIFAGAYGGATLSEHVARWFENSFPNGKEYAEAVGLLTVVFPTTYFSVVVGELVPKRFALSNPEALATRVAGPILVVTKLLNPIVRLLTGSTHVILDLFGIKPAAESPVTEEEVKIMVQQGTEAGVFEKNEESMIKRVIELGDLHAGDIMTPRTQVICLDLRQPPEFLLDLMAVESFSYYPAHEGQVDHPVGVIAATTILRQVAINKKVDFREALTEPLFVHEGLGASKVLERLKSTGKSMALVIDEFGGMAGIITLKDMLETIVGFMADEEEEEGPMVVQREDGSWLMDGMTPIRELPDLIGIESLEKIEAELDVQTLGGLVMAMVGQIPKEADRFVLSGFRFEVMDMDGHRVDKVLVTQDRVQA